MEETTSSSSTSEQPDGEDVGGGDDGGKNAWLIAGPVIAVALVLFVVAGVGAFLFYRYYGCGEQAFKEADAVRVLSKGGCVKMHTGGEEVKNLKLLQTLYLMSQKSFGRVACTASAAGRGNTQPFQTPSEP